MQMKGPDLPWDNTSSGIRICSLHRR